jgi:hypothetical protein
VTLDHSPSALATLYADIGRELASRGSTADTLAAVTRTAVTRVPGADWASITRGRPGAFWTVGATDARALELDGLQYELGTGPCVDAVLHGNVFRIRDLRTDLRWPAFSRRAVATAGVESMLSIRLFLENDDLIAGLNLYSTATAAFDGNAEILGTLVATHGANAVTAAAAREHAAQLHRALITNRDIGVAIGILMTLNKVTRDQAFDLLRVASQNSNRKLIDIALDVIDTGTLDLPGGAASIRPPASPGPRPPGRQQPRAGPPTTGTDR